MAISVFLSTVSDEFLAYREQLKGDLTRHNVAVKVQEDFKNLGGDTLDKLDVYIAHCDAVVHLVGDMCGAATDEGQQQALRAKHPDLESKLPPLGEALKTGLRLSYTQWEAWLALYHDQTLLIARAKETARRGPNYAPNDASRMAQANHLALLKAFHRYPLEFASPDDLAKHIAYSAILDLLVTDYAEKAAGEREVAVGFIREMAKHVAGDRALDLDGMKQAVRNAIEIYEKEVAGRPVETNFDDIVNRALAKAKEQVDRGQSGLARATLSRAADQMKREEADRRAGFEAAVTALYTRARDIALAAYDGDGAAEAMIALANDIHGSDARKIVEFLRSEAAALERHGDERGSSVHLVAAIALRSSLLALASSDHERAAAHYNLGNALFRVGERESGTARLDEAVNAYSAALEEFTRERAPLDWATVQTNLGVALSELGERGSGAEKLNEAVAAYRAALEEFTRERAPLDWASAQTNLGSALKQLGKRESGTEKLEEAIQAYRGALEERTRERVPLDWATTQMNLGNALGALGERESGTEKLAEGVAAYRAALEVWTREHVPLDWALAQMNLGIALTRLGERESGTGRLDEAVQAYRAALEERTRDRIPLGWATTQDNLGVALWRLGERDTGTARLEEAVAAFRAALEEGTRERVPLDWASTQTNLGNALMALGERESGTARLEEAVVAYRAALEERLRERVPLEWALTQSDLGIALKTLGGRESGTARLEEAVAAYRSTLEEYTRDRFPLQWATTQNNLGGALLVLGQREGEMAKLEAAVAAFGAALEERKRERVPLDWATSFGNQGLAMMLIAGRTNDAVLAETAVTQIVAAAETLRDGGHAQSAARFEVQLPKAQAIRDRLKGK